MILFFTHPLTTFFAGVFVTLAFLGWLLNSSAGPNQSAGFIAAYHQQIEKTGSSGFIPGGPGEAVALERFEGFLKGIGNAQFIRENTLHVYAADAFLDDTLVVHHGAASIEEYFVKTAGNMTSCEVTIDDVSKSGENYYVRWTMVFAAPAMSGGEPVHSVGISQVRFDREGKVAFHQDFWDSGKNFYAQLPVAGGVIGFIRKRLE
ncbi:MAG: nuclear transport factor 2 family protein [Luteolibacter sp.]